MYFLCKAVQMKEEILSSDQRSTSTTAKVVVASTVMLSFISFWRAAAIVLNDLGSSVYYIGGIVEHAIGPAGPWYVIAVFFTLGVTLYFWWYKFKDRHESSTKALRIMQLTTLMVVVFLVWCTITLLIRGPAQIPPPPTPSHLVFSDAGLGLSKRTWWPT